MNISFACCLSDVTMDPGYSEEPTDSRHHTSSDHVRHTQGQQQHRDDRSCQFTDDEVEVDISNSVCVHLKGIVAGFCIIQRNRSQCGNAAILAPRDHALKAHLLDNSLQPPLRAHQCDGGDDFGVEYSKSPVLQVGKTVETQSSAWTETIAEGDPKTSRTSTCQG